MKKTFLLMAAAVFMAVACDDSMMGGVAIMARMTMILIPPAMSMTLLR